MEEIKIGEYIRTDDGKIIKCNGFGTLRTTRNGERCEVDTIISNRRHYVYDKIVKHSPNIIDLIEESDYVNGERVLQKTKIKDGSMQICILKDNNSSNWRTINNFTLKNIVTKEQFNQVKYEV